MVVPFFISDGLHSYVDIPQLLGIEGEAFGNPHRLHGRALYYGNAIGTAPEFAEIILAQAENFPAAALDLDAPALTVSG